MKCVDLWQSPIMLMCFVLFFSQLGPCEVRYILSVVYFICHLKNKDYLYKKVKEQYFYRREDNSVAGYLHVTGFDNVC